MLGHMENELPTTEEGTTIHQAMALAAGESSQGSELIPTTIRLPENVREQARFICERHGTDLSSYLRQCTLALIRDYGFKSDEE